ncbi:MAG: alpha/beta fold hydrolase, partial [Gemmatimonadaceae bacterium]
LPASISRAVAWGSMRHAYGSLRGPDRGDLEQYLYPALLRGGRHGILAMARAFDWSARPASAFERITCRSVALFGRRDRVIGYDAAAACSRAMRRAIVSSVDNGGHVLAEESPEAVLRAVDGLLDAAEPAAPNAARHDRAAIP